MAPEYGSTCAHLPGRRRDPPLPASSPAARPDLIAAGRGLRQGAGDVPRRAVRGPVLLRTLELDLATVEPSLAGPKRPQDRVPLEAPGRCSVDALKELGLDATDGIGNGRDEAIERVLPGQRPAGRGRRRRAAAAPSRRGADDPTADPGIGDGDRRHARRRPTASSSTTASVVIAAITSCTNTSNPSVMVGRRAAGQARRSSAGSRQAVGEALASRRAPRVVTDYLEHAGLDPYLDAAPVQPGGLRLHDLHRQLRPAAAPEISEAIAGGRPRRLRGPVRQPQLRGPDQPGRPDQLPGLAAPGGRLCPRRDAWTRPDQRAPRDRPDGQPVFLRDIWPTSRGDQRDGPRRSSARRCSAAATARSSTATRAGTRLEVPQGERYAWDETPPTSAARPSSRACRPSPSRSSRSREPACWPCSATAITTDHISPAGAIKKDSPGRPLADRAWSGAARLQLLRLPARQPRGDDPRNVRQHPAPQPSGPRAEGGFTRHLPDGDADDDLRGVEPTRHDGVPLVVLAGKEYGSGSSRDWAAKGPSC